MKPEIEKELNKHISNNNDMIEICDKMLDQDFIKNYQKAMEKYILLSLNKMLKEFIYSSDRDLYFVEKIMAGSSEMLIEFTSNDEFGYKHIQIFSNMKAIDNFVTLIKDLCYK